MIKLSKIKIFKRATLSVLGIAFIAGGVFMATKIASIFHVNAAETDETPTAEENHSRNGSVVTIESPKNTWALYNDYANNTDHTVWSLSTPIIGVSDVDGQSIEYDAYCVEPAQKAPGEEEGGAQYTRNIMASDPDDPARKNDKIKLAIYMSSFYGKGIDLVDNKMDEWFDFDNQEMWNPSRWNGERDDSTGSNNHSGSYPNVADEAGQKRLRYLFMHLVVSYIYGGSLPNNVAGAPTEAETELINEIDEYLLDAVTTDEETGNPSDVWLMAQNYSLYQIDTSDDTSIQNVVWIEDGKPDMGGIRVIKCDGATEECGINVTPKGVLEGIKFAVSNNSGHRIYAAGIINENPESPNLNTHFFDPDEVLLTGETDESGSVLFSNLPLHVEFLVSEIGSNDHYMATAEPQEVILDNKKVVTKHFYNDSVWLDTTATDNLDGDKYVQSGTTSIIKDVVEYCVVPGQKYTIKGILMDKTTEKELLVGGETVTGGPVTIEPAAESDGCGTTEMTFEFDSSELGGKDLVVFETLYLDNETITSHEDMNDPGQTIRVVSLGTTATDGSDGDKAITAEEGAVINDHIEYCLVAGKEYTIIGSLMNKNTEEFLTVNDETVIQAPTITPEEDCGEVDMKFEFDATGLDGIEVVVFETVIDAETEEIIADHSDYDDEGQTIKILPKSSDTGRFTGSTSITSSNGGTNVPMIIVISVSVACVGTYLVIRFTAKRRFLGRR